MRVVARPARTGVTNGLPDGGRSFGGDIMESDKTGARAAHKAATLTEKK